jgi:hypothetical protein
MKSPEESGDFTSSHAANLARHLRHRSEVAPWLNAKFSGGLVERIGPDGRNPSDSDLAEMDGLWDAAKRVRRLITPLSI